MSEATATVDPIEAQTAKIGTLETQHSAATAKVDALNALRSGIRTGDENAVRQILGKNPQETLADTDLDDAMDRWFTEKRAAEVEAEKIGKELNAAKSSLTGMKADADWAKHSAKVDSIKTEVSDNIGKLSGDVRGAMVAFGVKSVTIHADVATDADGTDTGKAPAVSIVPPGADKIGAFKAALDSVNTLWPEVAADVKSIGFARVSFVIDGFDNQNAPNVSVAKTRPGATATKPATASTSAASTNGRGAPVSVNGQTYPTALDAFKAHYTSHPTYSKAGKGEEWAQNMIANAAQRNMRKVVAEIPGGVA